MSKLITVLFTVIFLFPVFAQAQRAYEVDQASQADVVLYITDVQSQADILLYFTDRQNQAYQNACDGVWYRSSYQVGSDFSFAYTTTSSQADFTVYMVNNRSSGSVVQGRVCSQLNRLIGD